MNEDERLNLAARDAGIAIALAGVIETLAMSGFPGLPDAVMANLQMLADEQDEPAAKKGILLVHRMVEAMQKRKQGRPSHLRLVPPADPPSDPE